MTTKQNILAGIRMIVAGHLQQLQIFMNEIRESDSTAYKVLSVMLKVAQTKAIEAIKEAEDLLTEIQDPWVRAMILRRLGAARRMTGDIDTAENCFLDAMEIYEGIGQSEYLVEVRMDFFHNMFFAGRYQELKKHLLDYLPRVGSEWMGYIKYFMSFVEIATGRPDKALSLIDESSALLKDRFYKMGLLEARGLALRLLGRFSEAVHVLTETARDFADMGAAYSVFPCAKALQTARLSGIEMPGEKLVQKCLQLADKGGLGEQAASREIRALIHKDDEQAVDELWESVLGYYKAYQYMEAVLLSLFVARLAWRFEHPLFAKVLRFAADLIFTHPGLINDPLNKSFLEKIEPLLADAAGSKTKSIIEAHLIGQLRVFVNGEELDMSSWSRKKALEAFIYLLLMPRHRMANDHLFYLLWPRRRYEDRTKIGFYAVIHTIRKRLGRSNLLTKNRDFYQLEDTWTDLEELENLIRLADATQDPDQKEEYLSRARELAQGELLPEFPYDRHIDEYRQYYKRLRKKLGLK